MKKKRLGQDLAMGGVRGSEEAELTFRFLVWEGLGDAIS